MQNHAIKLKRHMNKYITANTTLEWHFCVIVLFGGTLYVSTRASINDIKTE